MTWLIVIFLIILVVGIGSKDVSEMDNPFLARTVAFIALVILIAIAFSGC